MITKERFLKAYHLLEEMDELVDNLSSLHIDIVESKLFNGYSIFDILVEEEFTEEGQDLIFWFIYENCPHYIEEGETKIEFNTIEDLWDYLVKNDYVEE